MGIVGRVQGGNGWWLHMYFPWSCHEKVLCTVYGRGYRMTVVGR